MSGAALISFAPVLVKLTSVGPSTAAFYRLAIGGVALCTVGLLRRDRWSLSRVAFLVVASAGFFFAVDLVLWHRSIGLVGPGLATILANCQVFAMAGFGAVVLKERIGWRYAGGTATALVGLFLIFGRNWGELSPGYRWGVMAGLLAAASYATFLILLRASRLRSDGLATVPNMGVIVLMGALFAGVHVGVAGESFVVPSLTDWTVLIVYGVMTSVAWLIISRALPAVEVSRAGLILLLQPSLAFVWDLLFFSRPTQAFEFLGVVLALAGIYLGSTTVEKVHQPEPEV